MGRSVGRAAAPRALATRTGPLDGQSGRVVAGTGTVSRVSPVRRCSRTACGRPAIATLTYVYSDQTAVLGPLATYAEPHCYDLCEVHAEGLTAPRGWDVLRLAPDPDANGPSDDDLEALANAVREAARPRSEEANPPGTVEVGRRGHLRVLRSTDS